MVGLAHRGRDWLAAHDPGYGALRRALRTAILLPSLLAINVELLHNPTVAIFGAFGSISTMLLVDFRGPMRDRLQSQAALVIVGALLTCVGTLASRSVVAATLGMTVLGVAIIFSSVVSSVLAGATTSLLLGFILPVSLPGSPASIPDRLAGWGMAGGVSILAISLLWPAPVVDPLRGAITRACRALAQRLHPHGQATGASDASETDDAAQADDLDAPAREALAALSRGFLATPFRPTGLTTAARAAVRLVDELRWLGEIVLRPRRDGPSAAAAEIEAVGVAAAVVLERGAEALEHPEHGAHELHRARLALDAVMPSLQRDAAGQVSMGPAPEDSSSETVAVVSALDPAFRAQETSFMVDQIASNIEVAVAAASRSWVARALGRQPPGIGGRLSSIRERAGAHLSPDSVALHNSLRGGVALGASVLLSREIGVDHAFWVVFGTLSVIRSNALSTGQTFARALAGTVAGFVIGGLLVLAIGTNTTVLWILLPIVIVIAGVAPAAISFAAGQAGFTIVLFILFNILTPAGWRLGIVRLEDVALGGATSLAVGLLFWPRGAAAALGRALADSYTESAHYLTSAVDFAVSCCAPGMPRPADAPPARGLPEATRAAAASRRLDDAFRTYLVEQGPKRLALPDVAALVSGAGTLRLAGDAILALWREDGDSNQSRVAAARELLHRALATEDWYRRLAAALVWEGPVPDPDPLDQLADDRLVATIDHDLRADDGTATAAAVRVVWTGDHLDAARRLESAVVAPAREVVRRGALRTPRIPRPTLRRVRPATSGPTTR